MAPAAARGMSHAQWEVAGTAVFVHVAAEERAALGTMRLPSRAAFGDGSSGRQSGGVCPGGGPWAPRPTQRSVILA